MSFILQNQRRAIEKVFTRTNFTIWQTSWFSLNGRPVNLLGISTGIGTCSDIHGVNIAVLSWEAFNPKVNHPINFPANCSGAILIRNENKKELKERAESLFYINRVILVVEGLEVLIKTRPPQEIYVTLNNSKTSYIPVM